MGGSSRRWGVSKGIEKLKVEGRKNMKENADKV